MEDIESFFSGSYPPISDYAAIGDLRSLALVSKNGSIDWCCFPHFGGGSVFAAILDSSKGGRFQVSPSTREESKQKYLEGTNVLETCFRTSSGKMILIDLMPVSGNLESCKCHYPHLILRQISCPEGEVRAEVEWSPRFDYARSQVRMERIPGGWAALGAGERMTLTGLAGGLVEERYGPVLRGELVLKEGEVRTLASRWEMIGRPNHGGAPSPISEFPIEVRRPLRDYQGETARSMIEETIESWRQWVNRAKAHRAREWAGKWLPHLIRSELVLKMLTYSKTGAIVAAPTTSLPEQMGGVRNWDYRFSWIRDASLAAQALMSLGHTREAYDFLCWAERVSRAWGEGNSGVHIVFGALGEAKLKEAELAHLEGYRGSRPIRVGNKAYTQIQLEGLGELLSIGYELARCGECLSPHLKGFLASLADIACRAWRWPDHGIWEIREAPRHFVYSKAMLWMGLDRALRLHQMCGLQGDVTGWERAREMVREEVLKSGYDREQGCFVQFFGSHDLDAANLRLPLMGFLPFEDPRIQRTIDLTLERLMVNGLVFRYRNADGLPPGEGAFGLCTFWLVDALALSGRLEEAEKIFEGMVGRSNHVGLFSEQYDPITGEALGNFPQAFTHIGLINSAIYLAYARGWEIPGLVPIGTSLWKSDKNGRAEAEGSEGISTQACH